MNPRLCRVRSSGLVVATLVVLTLAFAAAVPADPPDGKAATAVFERFKGLSGRWEGHSTKGWTDRVSFKTIAAGSVVVWDSFDAHPGEEMLTLLHRDGERLLLTHYCVSKTQPRLVLSDVSADGREATFTFLDGTGFSSRDVGHMDKAVFRFGDAGRFSTRWTWYQNGQERWLEEVEMRRVEGVDAKP
jgi:hypothetical protein